MVAFAGMVAKPVTTATKARMAMISFMRCLLTKERDGDAQPLATTAQRRTLGAEGTTRGVTRLIHIQLGPPAGPRTSTSTGPGGPHIHIHARGLHIHHIQRQNGRIALEISKFSSDSRLAQSAALAARKCPKGSEIAKFSPAAR